MLNVYELLCGVMEELVVLIYGYVLKGTCILYRVTIKQKKYKNVIE